MAPRLVVATGRIGPVAHDRPLPAVGPFKAIVLLCGWPFSKTSFAVGGLSRTATIAWMLRNRPARPRPPRAMCVVISRPRGVALIAPLGR